VSGGVERGWEVVVGGAPVVQARVLTPGCACDKHLIAAGGKGDDTRRAPDPPKQVLDDLPFCANRSRWLLLSTGDFHLAWPSLWPGPGVETRGELPG